MKNQNTLRSLGALTLLLALAGFFVTCEDGYQPNIRGLSFYYEDNNSKKTLIDENNPLTVNSTSWTTLIIKCDLPSSLKEISIDVRYEPSELDVRPDFIDPDDDNAIVDRTNGIIKADKIDTGTTLSFQVKAKDGAGPSSITVTIDPGGITAVCNTVIGSVSGTTQVAKPTASLPDGAEVEDGTTITLSTTTPRATIYYTTSGIDPTPTSGTLYTGPITITVNTRTIKAFAVKGDLTVSEVLTVVYTIVAPGTVAKPYANPPAGAVNNGTKVTLATFQNAEIWYTTDGTTIPAKEGTGSTKYTTPIPINAATTIKAIAVKDDNSSAVFEAAYKINIPVMLNSVTQNGGSATSTTTSLTLTFSQAIEGLTEDDISLTGVYGVTAGTLSEPDGSGPVTYTLPISGFTTGGSLIITVTKTGYNISSRTVTIYYKAGGSTTVAPPTASPANGTAVAENTPITLTAATGTSIYYTLNGNDPTSTSGTLYSDTDKPKITASNLTLKAIAVKDGISSTVMIATYTILAPGTVATPTATPPTGTAVAAGSTVTLSTTETGATIYYTTNGDTPTTSSTPYTAPIPITAAMTIKAIAVKTGMSNSGILTAAYTILVPGTVATPTATPPTGTAVAAGSTVTLSTTETGATIYYTTNGDTPTTSSTPYTAPIPITAAVTIKAIAVKTGMSNSGILTAAYTILVPGTVATPTATPPTGTAVDSGSTVTLSTTETGATIYYTTNGDTPTTSSTPYTAPIPITAAVTIKAIAVKDGMTNSAIMTANYTIKEYIFEITFDKNSFAPGSVPATKNTAADGTVGTLTNATLTTPWDGGVTFGGWYDNAECTGDPITAASKVTKATKLYAKWSFTAGTQQIVGDTLEIENPGTARSTSGSQGSWSGTVEATTGSANFETGAIYYLFPAVAYDYDFVKLDYVTSGTAMGVILKRGLTSSPDYNPGRDGTGNQYPTLAASGNGSLEFVVATAGGNAANPSGIAMQRNNGGPITVKFTKVTFSKASKHTLTLNTNYTGGETIQPKEVGEGLILGEANLPDPATRTDYTFTGWNTAADGTGTAYTKTSTMPTSDLTLYAQWIISVVLPPITVNNFVDDDSFTELGKGVVTYTSATSFTLAANAEAYGGYGAKIIVDIGSAFLYQYDKISVTINNVADPPVKGDGTSDQNYKGFWVLGAAKDALTTWDTSGKNITTYTSGNNIAGTLPVTIMYDIDKSKTQTLTGEIDLGFGLSANVASYIISDIKIYQTGNPPSDG